MRKDNEWFDNENESWKDEKCYDVRFPEYKEDQNGSVHTYSIDELIKC
jgi:hypothetical protein